jgi:hypothetical protein
MAMEVAEFYDALEGFVKSLRRSGHSDAEIVEVVIESFERMVRKKEAMPLSLPRLYHSCWGSMR